MAAAPTLTTVDLKLAAMQRARASTVSDGDGARQATILVPANTSSEVVLADGSRQALTTLHLRATEYTIGASGPQAMPAPLPPSSGYTYTAEFSADEAVAAVTPEPVAGVPQFFGPKSRRYREECEAGPRLGVRATQAALAATGRGWVVRLRRG